MLAPKVALPLVKRFPLGLVNADNANVGCIVQESEALELYDIWALNLTPTAPCGRDGTGLEGLPPPLN